MSVTPPKNVDKNVGNTPKNVDNTSKNVDEKIFARKILMKKY
jgi:hypothetical protein